MDEHVNKVYLKVVTLNQWTWPVTINTLCRQNACWGDINNGHIIAMVLELTKIKMKHNIDKNNEIGIWSLDPLRSRSLGIEESKKGKKLLEE